MAAIREEHPSNVPGPFYVENECCTSCGVPQHIAPHLFGADDDAHCFVKRQPATSAEEDSMLRVLVSQELGCVRYRGADVSMMRRLVETGEGSQCDLTVPPGMIMVRRDHVSFKRAESDAAVTLSGILERLVSFLATQPTVYRTTRIYYDNDGAAFSVSWFEDRFHRIELLAPVGPSNRFLIRYFGPPRFSDTLYDWLMTDAQLCDARWQSQVEWQDDGAWHHAPW